MIVLDCPPDILAFWFRRLQVFLNAVGTMFESQVARDMFGPQAAGNRMT